MLTKFKITAKKLPFLFPDTGPQVLERNSLRRYLFLNIGVPKSVHPGSTGAGPSARGRARAGARTRPRAGTRTQEHIMKVDQEQNGERSGTGYTFFHSATMALLSVHFIYRYWAVFDTKLSYFKGPQCLIWFAYCTFFGLQYALGTYFTLQRDSISDEYLREDILLRYNVNLTEIPAMTILAYDPTDGSIRWRNIFGILNICAICNFQYGIMIYCGWAMHAKMEDKIKNFSETLRKHHKQFFKTLVLQITAPTIILFIPITIIIFLPLFNFDFISVPSGVMLCSFTLYPASDSLIVMYVVSEYRNTAKRLIRKGLNIQNSQLTTSKVYATTVNPTSTAPING
ncbi:hypothetical protein B9Z55_012240 [Caenorhabditis nigoni]|uniref:Seven TM Receptor n=1 Tax=Caenorhabditis nigoni TaxID=1611254 RepID=A0A2G5TWA3_9PELO|nr:hypothetical protein B9Z55_012240 [Caenorhabditis nigoni]